jgi:hypothetical protein
MIASGAESSSSSTHMAMAPFPSEDLSRFSLTELPFDPRPFSMLSPREESLLYALAKERYEGAGAIIDAGAFLGASTLCLGEGLRENPAFQSRKGENLPIWPPIHSYDLFVCPDDEFALRYFPQGTLPGHSIEDSFRRNIRDVSEWVAVHTGDIKKQSWSSGPVELLFVDLAKCWGTNRSVIELFFPALLPGQSLLVQQDFGTPYVPWVHVAMGYYANQFEALGMIGSSTVYRCRETPLSVDLRSIPLSQKLEYANIAMEQIGDQAVPSVVASKGMLLFMEESLEASLSYLREQRPRMAGNALGLEYLDLVDGMVRTWNIGSHLERDMSTKFERLAGEE